MIAATKGYFTEPAVLRDEIYQSNLFLQARKDFDLLGMRLFLIAVSGINPHFSKNDKYYDKEFKKIFVPTAKLTELLGSSKYLGMLPKACVKLEIATVKLRNDNDSGSKLLNLFKHVDYISREGFYVHFNDSLRPYLLDLLYAKKGYTRVNVNYLLKLTSLYAVRLLEILLQFQNIPHYKRLMEIERNLTVEQIRFMLNVPEGAYKSRMDNFRRHVLDLPIKEINDRTPYFLRYKPIKKGTKIVGFKFTLSTHNVPFKVAGKKPKFSNDAINYLRELGFKDEAARAIYNCCKGVEDCFLRIRRAEALFYSQRENVINRLGFLRRAIEQNWHSGSMPEKEDPHSKPGWSTTMDYHNRRPGVPVRGPNKPVEKPPNYLPSDKMDKKLSNAIAQGEFYTPAESNEQARQVTETDKKSTQAPTKNDSQGNEQVTAAPSESTPAASPLAREPEQTEPVSSASEPAQSEPEKPFLEKETEIPPPNGEDYYNQGYEKLLKLKNRTYATPEEYQKAMAEDFEEEMRELAEKKARARAESERAARVREETQRIQSGVNQFVDSVIEAANNKSGGWTALGDIVPYCLSYISSERIAKRIAEKHVAAEMGIAPPKPEQPPAIEPAPPPKPPPKPSPPIEEETEPAPPPHYLYILSPSEETIATGGSAMYKKYKELYTRIGTLVEASIEEEPIRTKLINEKRALERQLLEKGEILPYAPPPMPKRTINIPLPPPKPLDYKKSEDELEKHENIRLRGIEELIELYTEANRLNEEPESILKRTNGPNVKPLNVVYDTAMGRDSLYSVQGQKMSLPRLNNELALREVLEYWRQMLDYFVYVFEMTPVEMMRRYIKTFGYLPPLHVPTPKEMKNFKVLQRNVYTGKLLHEIGSNKKIFVVRGFKERNRQN